MSSHHLHHDPDVDDMLRAANARVEAAEAERDEARDLLADYEGVYDTNRDLLRRVEEVTTERNIAVNTARRLAEQQAAVLALADDFDTTVGFRGAATSLRAALSDSTALDALIARERAAAWDEGFDEGADDLFGSRSRNPYRATAEAEQ